MREPKTLIAFRCERSAAEQLAALAEDSATRSLWPAQRGRSGLPFEVRAAADETRGCLCVHMRGSRQLFWDRPHVVTGRAPNLIELHPILDLACLSEKLELGAPGAKRNSRN
jgi:hypothetical protein